MSNGGSCMPDPFPKWVHIRIPTIVRAIVLGLVLSWRLLRRDGIGAGIESRWGQAEREPASGIQHGT